MTGQNIKYIYNVAIYHLDSQFYIIPTVRKPPGASIEVLPLHIISDDKIEELANAIESAKFNSNLKYPSEKDVSDREDWDGDNERVWNKAQKSWSIFWRDDGTVQINFAKPYAKHRNGVEWIYLPEAKKILQPPVSPQDIAKEILNNL